MAYLYNPTWTPPAHKYKCILGYLERNKNERDMAWNNMDSGHLQLGINNEMKRVNKHAMFPTSKHHKLNDKPN